MRPANLIRSEPFKAALRVLSVFLVLYALASWALVRSVESTLNADLATLTRIESELLTNIYRAQGKEGLIAAISALEEDSAQPDRAYGLFDGRNLSLTGPLSVRPDFVGVGTREVSVLSRGRIAGQYVLWVDKVDKLTLVIGRNGDMVARATHRLSMGLIVFGGLLTLAAIGLGLWAGHRSQERLDQMETALRQVSKGHLDTRLPIGPKDDQFDRVAMRMNENLARLERLVASVKSTASAIAHDLKTPLSHAQIAMHEAADALSQGEADRDALGKIDEALEETAKLNTIFETVLRLSRIQAVQDHSHFTQVSLGDVAEKAIEFLQPVVEEEGQRLSFAGDQIRIKADPGLIEQAVVNLVQNACVHAGPGAKITVQVRDLPGEVVLSVEDTGPGIPDEVLPIVREPFARGAADRSTPGHGLGLAIVTAIAELHDADLSLRNTDTGFSAALSFPKSAGQ